MAKGKYEIFVRPKLFLIECWARDGLSACQIAEKLGVGKSSFYNYLKEYPELSMCLNKEKDLIDYEIENALLEKAKGGIRKVVRPYKLKRVLYENGKKVEERETIEYADYEEYVPPDTRANIFWLKNRRPDKWRESPSGEDRASGQMEALIQGLQENEEEETEDTD